MVHTVEQVEIRHLGKSRALLVLNTAGIEVSAELHPDQVDDLLVEAKDASDKTEEYLNARQQDAIAERMWRE